MRTCIPFLAFLLTCAGLPAVERPAWLTELSVVGRTGYDTNLFNVDNARPDAPLADRAGWAGSLGVKVAVSVSALLEAPRDQLQLGYAPTFNWFEGATDENHAQHRFTVTSTGRRSAWSWAFDSATTYTDGPEDSPRFNTYNIFGMGLVRDRRTQLQEAGKAWLRYDRARWFVRGTAATLINDYRTALRAPTAAEAGRLNWVDRSDFNGGVDLGWKISPAASLLLGGRLGRQHQATTAWLTKSSSNHYTRVLLGFEGRPTRALSGSLLAGPDFRRYAATTQCMSDRTPVAWFYAGNLTATLTATDTLTLTAKQERWLSSTGQSAYDAQTLSLAWQHGFSDAWSLQLSGQWQQGKYPAPIVRNDVLCSGQAQVRWRATKQFAVTLDVALQSGADLLGLPVTAGRDFHRSQLGVGVQRAF
ncbi:hypothetical protein ESB00_03355 [Oleiharenicola lentus]|uniref:Alginate export domain-containing protein n=1 Tax=Oleiharenicola lentus TaxID=2508720 RepID=A0A4Q1C7V6_9BACT|nr:hypothetical protein [Oleiharenicola lentus]RXK54948.1 hypothetical protein ESB00_03355 [Oleiharenicola lentus]